MPVAYPEPTAATAKEIYANAYQCAKPGCRRPLYRIDSESGARTLNSRIAHICARSEGGPRWDASMSAEQNRAVSNLLVLCLEHAVEVDDPGRSADFRSELLKSWKASQLAEFDQIGQGWALSGADVAQAIGVALGPGSVAIIDSDVTLGGEGGSAVGAGGGGGAAIGAGAIAGDGGSGGNAVWAVFPFEDLPDTVTVTVGEGGAGGEDGDDGGEGGDSSFGDLLTATGSKGADGANSKATARDSALTTRLSIPAMFFADFAEVRDGLLFVVGGGWGQYDTAGAGGNLAGVVGGLIEVEPGESGGDLSLALRLVGPGGSTEAEGTALIEVAATPALARTSMAWLFAVAGAHEGLWTAQVLTEAGVVLGEHVLSVRGETR